MTRRGWSDLGFREVAEDTSSMCIVIGSNNFRSMLPADSVPMLSVAAPLLAALRLPGSAHRRVSERAIGSGQMSMPHQDFRGRRNLKEPAIV